MNENHDHDDRGAEDWRAQDWSELDDTLADGPSPESVPEASKRWLAEQRFLHGLLRALHTADAAGREGRIAGILERIDAERAAVPARRRHWAMVTAAAVLFAVVAVWFALPAKLPTAEAAVGRAVAELARDIDRRFRIELVGGPSSSGPSGSDKGKSDSEAKQVMRHEFALVARPGMRFRVDGKFAFGPVQFGEIRIGCDGQELWVLSANNMIRKAWPLTEREGLMALIGDVLDLGYLDVHDLVKKLPEDFDLRVVARETDANGRPQLRIAATRRNTTRVHLRSAWLLCDEATGMVTQVEVDGERRGMQRKLTMHYLGEESPGLVDYQKPW